MVRNMETDIWIDIWSNFKLYATHGPYFSLRFTEPRSLNQLATLKGIVFCNSLNTSCIYVSGYRYSCILPVGMKAPINIFASVILWYKFPVCPPQDGYMTGFTNSMMATNEF